MFYVTNKIFIKYILAWQIDLRKAFFREAITNADKLLKAVASELKEFTEKMKRTQFSFSNAYHEPFDAFMADRISTCAQSLLFMRVFS